MGVTGFGIPSFELSHEHFTFYSVYLFHYLNCPRRPIYGNKQAVAHLRGGVAGCQHLRYAKLARDDGRM